MFGNKKDEADGANGKADKNPENLTSPPLKPFSKKGSHAPTKPPTSTSFQPDSQRRVPEIPGNAMRRMDRPASADSDSRRLVVGREICLSGEITACDKLIVEGRVEVNLSNARAIEVTGSGVFKGSADVEEADISGHFEGDLIARERLIVRAGGHIRGKVRYGRIVIESGGEISGDMQTLEPESHGATGSDN